MVQKTQICPSTGMAWDSVLETARLFYTETNPQKKCQRTKHNRWPIHCQAVCCSGRFTVFWFSCSRSHSLLVHETRTPTRKRLVTTPKGILVRPCSWSRCVVTLLAEPKGAPVPSRTHMHTRWHTCTSSRGGAVRECMLKGRGRIKQLLKSDCET